MVEGQVLVDGAAAGTALVLSEPLSFWGGLDPATGAIIDVHHPQHGAAAAGTVLVLPSSRGSSSSPSVLAEALRLGTAPAAIVLSKADPMVVLGVVVAEELYGRSIPVVVAPGRPRWKTGAAVVVSRGGRITLGRPPPG